MPAHCGTSDVRQVLGVANGTAYNAGSTGVKNKITDVDLLIDEKLNLFNLSVSGTAQDLVTNASKYMATALYKQDFYIRRDKEGKETGGQSKIWWDMGSTFLHSYIVKQTEEYDRQGSRERRLWSTTTKNP